MTDREYLAKVGIEIKVARIRKKMSVRDVMKITGLSKPAIGQLERGINDSHILTYKKVADALGVEMKDFF